MQFLEISEISGLLQSKKVSPVELTKLMIERIQALDPLLNSYAYTMAESAFRLHVQPKRRSPAVIGVDRFTGFRWP